MNEGNEGINITLKDIGVFRVTDRDLDHYKTIFGFSPESFRKGSFILNIGSGYSQKFARELEKERRDIKVFSIDPSLALPINPSERSKERISYQRQTESGQIREVTQKEALDRLNQAHERTIAAIAPHLPFKDESFDYVFDNHGAFMYFPSEEYMQAYLEEIFRILKPNGEVFIYPLDIYNDISLDTSVTSEELEKDRIKKSKERIKRLISRVKEKFPNITFEIFQKDDFPEKDEKMIRLGVKIIKRI